MTPAAVVWLSHREAIVGSTWRRGDRVTSLERDELEPLSAFLNRVLDQVGDAGPVIVVGPEAARLELERAYVSMYRRPDRLLDVAAPVRLSAPEILARLHQAA